jgi:hypothetical protein
MIHEIRQTGEHGARLHFDATEVVLDDHQRRTVIPLDQVAQMNRRYRRASLWYLALVDIAILVAIYGYIYGPPEDGSAWWAYASIAAAIAIVGIVLFFTLKRRDLIIASPAGAIRMPLRKDQVGEADEFMALLMDARTAFFDGEALEA